MKIAIDCDDVLSDSIPMLRKQHNLRFPKNRVPDNLAPIWQEWNKTLDAKTINQLYTVFQEDSFILSLLPKHDAVKGVKELTKLGCEIVIVTSRVSKVAKPTRQWAEKYFSGMISDIFHLNYNSLNPIVGKEDICKENEIRLLIDDHPYIIESMRNNGINTLLFDCPWNQDVIEGPLVLRVRSWQEIADYVRNLMK